MTKRIVKSSEPRCKNTGKTLDQFFTVHRGGDVYLILKLAEKRFLLPLPELAFRLNEWQARQP